MSSDIRPEDIEAAIAAAEQRRRSRLGGAADVGTTAPASRRPVLPERVASAGAEGSGAASREAVRPLPGGSRHDDLDDSWLDQPARPSPAASRYADLPEGEVVWEPDSGRRGLGLAFGIGAVTLLIFGGILWWAYSSDGENAGATVPVIAADETPIKVKPEEEGGLEVPDQDKLVYDNIAEGEEGTGKVEQLLPGPEEPVTPPQPATAAAIGTAQPAPLTATEEDTDAALAEATPPPAAPEPAPAAAAPAEPVAPAPVQEAAAPAAAAPAPTVQPATGGSWKIQLAAVKSDPAARQEWGRMQQAHSDLLGDMRLTVQRADLGDKGVYFRIQAGPLPDRTTAEDVCAELKAAKQPCLVVKP